ncbi:MAG TPA: O-antigen ligase family protein [Gaiellaceae bacterium]|nr:O-antigen ligase family protein [Gaiellaceae bacterium]
MTSSIRWTRRIGPSLLAAAFLVASFLAGGFYESTYSLLAAAVWLGIAIGSALAPLRRPSLAVLALAGFAAWTLLSALWGPAGPALRVAPLAVLYAGALLAAEQVDRRLLLRLTWAACVIVATVAFVALLAGLAPEAAGPDSDRLSWPLGYANGLGLVAVIGVVLSFRERPRLAFAGGSICALAAVLTFSRTSLLAGLVGLVVAAALGGRIPQRVALGGAVLLSLTAILLAQPVAARFAAPAPDEGDARRLLDVSGHGRAELWRVAWEEGLEHPLLGAGGGTWARAYLEEQRTTAAPANAHSLPLETFAELGLVGVVLLATFGFAVVRRAGGDPLAAGAVVAWAVASSADWTWQLPAATLPALFAAAALTRSDARVGSTRGLALALCALAVGLGCALHGVGAALLEEGKGRSSATFLPFDARPWLALEERERACLIDPGEPAIRRADPSNEGCIP